MLESLSQPASEPTGIVLVTGGSGLVGSHLIRHLLKIGKNVKALYRSGIPKNDYGERVYWVKGDVLDILSLEEAFKHVQQVYHCAAIISYSPAVKQQMFRVNIEGTANVVNACLTSNVQRLCFVSSVAALGRTNDASSIDESMNWTKETSSSNYGKSKYLAETEVWRGVGEGLESVVVNPSIILGCGDWHKGSSQMFKSAYNEFPWFTEGSSGFVDVKDLVNVMTILMEKDITGERFIINSENCTYKYIFTAMAKAFGKRPPYKKVSHRMAEWVWRAEQIKSLFNNSNPLLTKETADSAQAVIKYNNEKLFQFLPSFRYTPVEQTINRVCGELVALHQPDNKG